MEIFKNLNELIFPARCLSCSTLGASICTTCGRSWSLQSISTSISHGDQPALKVTSSVLYSPTAQKILLAAKESQIFAADLLVEEAIRNSLRNVLRDEWIDFLIPIPSRASAVRKRGRQFIEELARGTGESFSIPIHNALRHTRKVRDQSGLAQNSRWNNLQGALVAEGAELFSGRALLVDDLVTTGATLIEAARALRYAGIEVAGAVTAAVALTSKIPHAL